jgi:predicted phosphate transport protein (TIGR00153 family)
VAFFFFVAINWILTVWTSEAVGYILISFRSIKPETKRKMAFSFLPREDLYFSLFTQMAGKIEEAAGILMEMLESSGPDLSVFTKRIKDVEHSCDQLTHEITTKLNKSFITPFDREDIYTLSVALDDICDFIDAGARVIVMYDIREFNDDARTLALIIRDMGIEIKAAVSILSKPHGINQHFIEIHRLENEADDVYFRAIGRLFKDTTDPITVIKWKELYEILENATDRAESVANIIESIVLKHN